MVHPHLKNHSLSHTQPNTDSVYYLRIQHIIGTLGICGTTDLGAI